MAGADGDTPAAAVERMRLRQQRLLDSSAVYRQLAVEFSQQTASAFRNERSPFGEDWLRLARSTVARRVAKLPGASSRSKKTGRLTKGARIKRAAAAAVYDQGGGNIKPLVDSGRLRQSIAYTPTRDGIEITAVWYIRYHVTGSLKVRNRPPKRNPLVIQQTASGAGYALIPAAHTRFLRAFTGFVETGTVPAAA